MPQRLVASEYTFDALEVVDVQPVLPGAGDVLIEVRAAALNPADVKGLVGMFGRDPARLPLVIGAEVAGVVMAVGSEVTTVRVGDEVIAYRVEGGVADQVVTKASAVFAKPADLPWEQAAGLLLAGTTAWHLLEATAVAAGDTVVVHGASGAVGSLVVQLARLRGARVIGTASSFHLAEVSHGGCDGVVEYGPGLVERLRQLLPSGADVALDTTGTREALDASIELVADRQRIAAIAGYDHAAELGVKRLGFAPGADAGIGIRDAVRSHLIDLAGQGKLRVRVAHSFDLEHGAEAMALVSTGRADGKVIVRPSRSRRLQGA